MPSTGLVKSASTGQISSHILPRDVSMEAVLGLFELHAGYAIQRWMDQGPEEDHWSALNPPPPASLSPRSLPTRWPTFPSPRTSPTARMLPSSVQKINTRSAPGWTLPSVAWFSCFAFPGECIIVSFRVISKNTHHLVS
ncbi:hypothetical protein V2G26_015644 [Clonostachys chloroleuca]